MADSVKHRVINRVVQICQPLVQQGVVRSAIRKHQLFLTEAVMPALHIVPGDEKLLHEDYQGYNAQFPIAFQIMYEDPSDPEGRADKFEAFIKQTIEADEQLGGLASKITWNGSAPFVLEELNPVCLSVIVYLFEYRWQRGKPDVGY